MITIIPIEPINEAHALLVIEAFNRFFVDRGGSKDGYGYGFGNGGYVDGNGNGNGYGFGNGGNGNGYGDKCPEEWRAE